jgi:hypothetical protein
MMMMSGELKDVIALVRNRRKQLSCINKKGRDFVTQTSATCYFIEYDVLSKLLTIIHAVRLAMLEGLIPMASCALKQSSSTLISACRLNVEGIFADSLLPSSANRPHLKIAAELHSGRAIIVRD